jgi:hypothetical protein
MENRDFHLRPHLKKQPLLHLVFELYSMLVQVIQLAKMQKLLSYATTKANIVILYNYIRETH